jgi:Periplasmic sensor domain
MQMGALNDRSVKFRLMLLTLSSSALAVLFAFILFASYDNQLLRQHKEEELRSAADLIAASSASALILDDSASATNQLRALQSRIHIQQGVLYLPDGTT